MTVVIAVSEGISFLSVHLKLFS